MGDKIKRNTSGIETFRKKKQNYCCKRVDEAINKLLLRGDKITFNSVSIEANVSKKYLYEHHFERINQLRSDMTGVHNRSRGQVKSDASKDIIIQAKNKRIKELEAQVKYLEGILKQHCADVYEQL